MTYIVELKQPGINAIISDARVSWRGADNRWTGEDSAVKTGLLFRGCIFGRVGDASHSRDFVISFRSSIEGKTDTIAGFWQRFEEFVESYPFPRRPEDQFQLLISTRASGQPRFYVLSSSNGLSQHDIDLQNYIASYGRGRKVLDLYIKEAFTPRIKALQEYLINEQGLQVSTVRSITPYFLCLWLSELSLTSEGSMLADHHVGGVFHFVYQTHDLEGPQRPAIYVFSAADRKAKTIYSWSFRVAYVQGGLYVERHVPASQDANSPAGRVEKNAFFADASRPDVINIPEDVLRDAVKQELDSLPFYFFCGFGFTSSYDRKSFGFIASSNGKKEDIFDEEGRLRPRVQELVISNFAGE